MRHTTSPPRKELARLPEKYSAQEIAEQYGVTANTVRYWFRQQFASKTEFKRTPNPRNKLVAEDIPLIRALKDERVRVADIADKFDVSTACIYNVLEDKYWGHVA